ncbi:hypothetical protein FUAX_44120 (plasmid) [Fulvitalea axinellae]|uniref:FecR family protein n=2 Tax=Fulvitalea axinellae TaxID=1182444 RepID=A0AAU9DLD3_9BACT|nr:hypothetical protein FUAX_44120 [Fulvitalea axinellae]
MKDERIRFLADKHLSGQLGEEELTELGGRLDSDPDQAEVFAEMMSEAFAGTDAPAGLWIKLKGQAQKRERRIKLRLWLGRVAAGLALLAVAFVGYRFAADKAMEDSRLAESQEVELLLSDGTKVPYSALKDSLSEVSGKGFIRSLDSGSTLNYEKDGFQSLKETYNTIRVPSGKRFALRLSDGSRLVLNSETEVRYPVVFKGTERNIELLAGEIYCVIAKNKIRPFHVSTDRLKLRVLGTEFNLSAYKNENISRAVLVEGSVGILPRGSFYDPKKAVVLSPGQALSYNRTTKKVIRSNVDVGLYTAWKDGRFVFHDMPLDEIFGRVERWYGVKINSEFRLPGELYRGELDEETVDDAMEALSYLCGFKYKKDSDGFVVW